MKRAACIIAVLVVFLCCAFAYQNTYGATTAEYRKLVSLYRIAGMAMHGVVTPVSSDDMLFLLDELPMERLPEKARDDAMALRDRLRQPEYVFSARGVMLDAKVKASPVGILNTDKDIGIEEIPFDFKDIDPLFLFEGAFYFGEHFTGLMGLDLIKSADQWEFSPFDMNLETELNGDKMDFYRPHRAYFSAGYGRFNLILGRDRMSAGNGFTGNLTIGDNFFWQDFAKVSLLFPFFSYNLTVAAFDPNETLTPDNVPKTAKDSLDYSTWDGYHPEVLNHRLSLNFFNRVTFTLTEGVMQFTDNAAGTVKMLNPFNIFHNQFTFRNHRINNYFAVELDAVICPGLSVHFQFIGDQIQLAFESVDTTPNSYGMLLNIAYSFPLERSLATVYLEGVYTSPSLYLKDDKTAGGGQIPPNPQDDVGYDHRHTDLIFGNRMTGYDDYDYMGYTYGPDAIVAAMGFEAIGESSSFSSRALFMVHGENRIDKDTHAVPTAPVMDRDEPKFIFTPYVTGDNVPEYSLVLNVNYERVLAKMVSVRVAAAFDNRWNHGNAKDAKFTNFGLLFAVRVDLADWMTPIKLE